MLCDDVKRVIYFFLDGQLGSNKQQDLTQHVDRCPDCGARINIQRRLRLFVRRRLIRLTASDRLKTRLARSLRALT